MATDAVAQRPLVAITAGSSTGQTGLKTGQIVTARIEAHLPDGTTRLAIGEARIDVRLPGRTDAGDTLRLQVVRTSPNLALNLLGTAGRPAGNAGSNPVIPSNLQADLQGMIRSAVADQDSVAPLLTGLERALASGSTPLPEGLRQAVEQLLGFRLPANPAPSGEALRQAILKSGVFLEANLARGAAPGAGGDMKAALLALQTGLRAWLGGGTVGADTEPATSLLSQTRAALSKLRLAQAGSLKEGDTTRAPGGEKPAELLFELPFQAGGRTLGIEFRIDRDNEGSDAETDPGWRIRFSIDAEPLGPVHAIVSLRGGALGVALWAERADGADLLRRRAPELTQALESTELEITGFNISTGRPPRKPHPSGAVIDRQT